jgi:ribosomal protein S27E
VGIHVRSASMLIRCRIPAGCFSISTVFSHAQTVVICSSCSSVLCQPTGGRARLTEGKDCLVRRSFCTQRSLHQGAHTVGRIERSLPCIHPTCCLHYSLRSAYISFRLSCGWPQYKSWPLQFLIQTSSCVRVPTISGGKGMVPLNSI